LGPGLRDTKLKTIQNQTKPMVRGALENSHIGYHGTDFTLQKSATDLTRVGNGSVGTVYAGHILMQVVTEHLQIEDNGDLGGIIKPPLGCWDERLVEIEPRHPRIFNWPTKPFTDEGSNRNHRASCQMAVGGEGQQDQQYPSK